MAENLAALFMEAKAPVIEWQGAPAYSLFKFQYAPRALRVEILALRATPVQGLRLSLSQGMIEVNGQQERDVVLWADTAPSSVLCEVSRGDRESGVLKLWNVWQGGGGLTQAWLGNAAMRVDEVAPNRLRLRCNVGEGDRIDFGDLLVELTVLD